MVLVKKFRYNFELLHLRIFLSREELALTAVSFNSMEITPQKWAKRKIPFTDLYIVVRRYFPISTNQVITAISQIRKLEELASVTVPF